MGTWESTLQPRDINNDGTVDAFYDTVLNISWLADGNAGAGSRYDSGNPTDGQMTWSDAMAWAADLEVFGLQGWRLPTLIDQSISGGCQTGSYYSADTCGLNVPTISTDGKTVYSEWAHLYYVTLGNLAACDANGDCSRGDSASSPDYMLQNTGAFREMKPSSYWSGLFAARAGAPFEFNLAGGFQFVQEPDFRYFALAVRPGDATAVAQVPEPQTALLSLTALGALLAASGRRRSKRTPTR